MRQRLVADYGSVRPGAEGRHYLENFYYTATKSIEFKSDKGLVVIEDKVSIFMLLSVFSQAEVDGLVVHLDTVVGARNNIILVVEM